MTMGGAASSSATASPASPLPRSIHLLVVHGVGRHDRLSSLLHVFQSFRANLQSQEAPIGAEDRLLDWTLDEIAEDGSPPYLKLVPLHPEAIEDISAVYLYEVNYSSLAGVVRSNHRLDLTRLFVGFDMAVCIARLRLSSEATSGICGGRPRQLASILQRVSGVFASATVPLLGLPSLLLRNYTETLVATFTRFFEDVATFALDSNGERLIAAHIDKTVDNIVLSDRFTVQESELVIAAHSLGSVVAHNHLVRHWSSRPRVVPSLFVTFGSPIGLLTWLWLFLDFPDLNFKAKVDRAKTFFSWTPATNSGAAARRLRWINVVNRLDPIATTPSTGMADLSRTVADVNASLVDDRILHRYCGDDCIRSTGAAHSHYWYDREGFLRILLGASRLGTIRPEDVKCNDESTHWDSTSETLWRVRVIVWQGACAVAAAYCAIVAAAFSEPLVMATLMALAFPRLTIAYLAFFQRLLFGGPSKRVPPPKDEEAHPFVWADSVSFPYRLNRVIFKADVDPEARRPSLFRRTLVKIVAFAPAGVLMLLPIAVGSAITRQLPNPIISIYWYLGSLVVFSGYLLLCAGSELISVWRAVLAELKLDCPSAHPRHASPLPPALSA